PAGFRRVRRSRRARPARAVGPPTGRGALVPRLPAPHGQVGAGGAVVRAPASGSPTGTAVRQPLKIALWSTAVGYGGPPGWAAHPVRTDVRIRAGVWGRRQGSGGCARPAVARGEPGPVSPPRPVPGTAGPARG